MRLFSNRSVLRRRKVVSTTVTHLLSGSYYVMSSHQILVSSVIYHEKDARQKGIYLSISKAVSSVSVFMHFDWPLDLGIVCATHIPAAPPPPPDRNIRIILKKFLKKLSLIAPRNFKIWLESIYKNDCMWC